MERTKYEELLERGGIAPAAAEAALAEIQMKMRRLLATPSRVPIPETATLVERLPLFAGLAKSELAELADITDELVFEAGVVIIEEGSVGDSMYVIARGAVHVVKNISGREEFLGVLGGGEIVGEMSLLTAHRRAATVRAATTVTVGRVSQADFDRVMEGQPGLRDRIWQRFAAHQFDNLCRADRRFSALDRKAREAWLGSGDALEVLEPDTNIEPDSGFTYLVSGALNVSGTVREAPLVLETKAFNTHRRTETTRIIRLPQPPR